MAGEVNNSPELDGARVLVTGATGFLGGHVVRRLLERGAEVVGQGRDAARLEGLRAAHGERFRADRADLSVGAEAERLVLEARPELTVHCAALSAPFGPKEAFRRANVLGTEHLVAALSGAGASGLVHVSTPSLYCAGAPLRDVREDAPLPRRAINRYAWSKGLAEQRVRSSGLAHVILRPRAIFGPGDTALFPRLVKAMADGRLPVIGDGENVVDLTYVDDVCAAIEAALGQLRDGRGPAIGGTYNVTGGAPVPLWEVIRRVARTLGLREPGTGRPKRLPRSIARPAAGLLEGVHRLLRRSGEPRLTRYSVDALSLDATLDISAARRDLGYAPAVSVDEGIERFLRSLP